MAIDRGPWNALVDDDGSNLVGSIWNKAAIKTVLLDPIDALGGSGLTVIANTETGARNNWAPAGFGAVPTLIRWSGASALAVTGLVAGVVGQTVTLANYGTALLTVAPLSASSSAGNKFVNTVGSAPTPISVGGFATYVYSDIGGENGWRLTGHEQGGWITAPYSAAYFLANASAWTVDSGDMSQMNYYLSGRSLTVAWSLNTTSIAAGSNALQITNGAWGGFTAGAYQAMAPHIYTDAVEGANKFGFCQTGSATNVALISIYRNAAAAWSASTNGTVTAGTLIFPVS